MAVKLGDVACSFGAKTLNRYGGYPFATTASGTFTLSGAAATAGFQVEAIADDNNVSQQMITLSGSAGTENGRTLSGTYTGTATHSVSGDWYDVTITIIPNAYHVRAKWADTASAFELRTNFNSSTSLALGDRIILRAGRYNRGAEDGQGSVASTPGIGHDWIINRSTAPSGTWSGSNYVVIEGEGQPTTPFNALGWPRDYTDYTVFIHRLTLQRSGANIDQYAHFKNICFRRTCGTALPLWNSGTSYSVGQFVFYGKYIMEATGATVVGTPPKSGAGTAAGWTQRGTANGSIMNFGQGGNGPGKCKISNVLVQGDPDYTKLAYTDAARFYGIGASGSGAADNNPREIVFENIASIGMIRTITAIGDPATPTDCFTFDNIVDRHSNGSGMVVTDTTPWKVPASGKLLTLIDKKVGGLADPWDATSNIHGDGIIYAAGAGWGSINYEFGTVKGVFVIRGEGSPGSTGNDCIAFIHDNKGTCRAQNAVFEHFVGVTTFSQGITLWKHDNPTIRRVTLLSDLSPNSPVTSARIHIEFVDCTGEVVDRVIQSGAQVTRLDASFVQIGTVTPTNSLLGVDTLAAIDAAITTPTYYTDVALLDYAGTQLAWGSQLVGTAKQADGTYAGALFPDGTWNDGSVYGAVATTYRPRPLDLSLTL